MQCRACGYESLAFQRFGVPVYSVVNDGNDNEHFKRVGYDQIFACPKCGTLRVEVEIEKSLTGRECQKQGDTDHEKLIRGFVWSNKAWYAEGANIKEGEINFGLYSTEGGTTGEMSMRWIEIGEEKVPRLEVFFDAWETLAGFKDVIDALVSLNDKNITDFDFVKILLSCGFSDLTKYICQEGE
jgi:hypothetical protein